MTGLERLARKTRYLADPEMLVRLSGVVSDIGPTFYKTRGLSAFTQLGDSVALDGGARHGEVVRVEPDGVTIKPYASTGAIRLGMRVWKSGPVSIAASPAWKGRVVDAFGTPRDGGGPLETGPQRRSIVSDPLPSLERARVRAHVKSGVRLIDIFTPLCHGQRIGIFAGSGVGKSTLLGMLAGCQGFDTIVIALVGERGREVREFIEDCLGTNKSSAITVVATSDESATMRHMAPLTAMTVAETFRDRGDKVLLLIDSVTRFAHAAREIALAAGEPAVARGYAPSVFTTLPRLLERAGPGRGDAVGSITGVFSVLVDGDDHNDPIADCIRGTLDGHIVLARRIAEAARYPAIDILASISRLAPQVWTPDQKLLVGRLRAMLARYEETRDLRAMGGVQPGQDPDLDQAILLTPTIYDALTQAPDAPASIDAFRELAEALNKSRT